MRPANKESTFYQSRGFTFIELAFAIVILALLLGALLVPLSTQIEQRKVADTKKSLDEIKEALIGYAMANGRLPRPAQAATNGVEVNTCACPSPPAPSPGLISGCGTEIPNQLCTGFLPWSTLGVARGDAWGKLFKYSVTPAFTQPSLVAGLEPVTVATSGNRDIETRPGATALAVNVAAVVVSHGLNNFGTTESGVALGNTSVTNTDEVRNANAPDPYPANGYGVTKFMSKQVASNTAAEGGEFDDIVVWIPSNVLIARIVTAGRLP